MVHTERSANAKYGGLSVLGRACPELMQKKKQEKSINRNTNNDSANNDTMKTRFKKLRSTTIAIT